MVHATSWSPCEAMNSLTCVTPKAWRGALRRFKQRVLDRRLDPELRRIREVTERAYRAGFEFHQEAVRRDPALLAWVTRADYLDYRLPEGWEQFGSASGASG